MIHAPAFHVNGNSPEESHHARDGNVVGRGPNEPKAADSRLSNDDAPGASSMKGFSSGIAHCQ